MFDRQIFDIKMTDKYLLFFIFLKEKSCLFLYSFGVINMTKEKRIQQVFDSLVNYSMGCARCIIIVNNKTKTYECLQRNDCFKSIISEVGTTEELYDALFLSSKRADKADVCVYKKFEDLSVFERDHYCVNLHAVVDEKENEFRLLQTRISNDEMSIVITEQDHIYDSNLIEKEKADTIQESYLFSMIVDLKEDACINPNTTEVRSERQDFMDIKYSDWRLMISNMFKEQDQILFLRASSAENVINTLESKPRFHIDLQMMNMQGQYAWSRLSFARMKNFSRENPRFLYTVNDISEEMNQLLRQEGITKAVEEQNEILQRVDEEKTRFFANMSHEFRAPINAIMGMNEVILANSNEDNIREYAGHIKDASRILLQLVNDVLDFSKIEAGKMEIVPIEYENESLIQNVCNMIKLMAEEKALEFEVKVSDDVPKRLFGDEIRISQILTNLLTNAVKYTDNGKVILRENIAKDAQGMDAIEYVVEDTGCGIKPEDMEKLFDTYGRIDIERNRRVEGTGLGIGIVIGLLEAMNSTLKVESEYGKGSRFSFVLTQNYVETEVLSQSEENNISDKEVNLCDKKILLVDDASLNLMVTDVLLNQLGGKADMADNGFDALKMMEEKEYDIIFLDHNMPDIDGVETLKRARKISDYYKNAVFIALTGNTSSTARDEYMCMGFTDYLEKPICIDKMKEIIQRLL